MGIRELRFYMWFALYFSLFPFFFYVCACRCVHMMCVPIEGQVYMCYSTHEKVRGQGLALAFTFQLV